MNPLVSFVILTRNRCEHVLACLQSIAAQDYPCREVVVLDNGSSDDTARRVRQQYPEVHLVACSSNLGVAGGRNRAIEAAHGDICLVIDDDARLASAAATRACVDTFLADRAVGCVAFRIVNAVTGAEDRKTIPRADKRRPADGSDLAYFCGAGFAVRRQVFLDLGGFWEALGYAGEELDFSYRLLSAGHRIVYAAALTVLHDEAPAARPHGQWVYFQARNRCWIALRNLPWRFAIPTTLTWWAYTATVAVKERKLRFFLAGVRDALRGAGAALDRRSPIDRSSVRAVRRLSGRLWY